jgi:glycosyltransferase involved in cell wall biosynthesis
LAEISVLHIAPENTAGVPYNVMEMQRRFGFESRLLTFYKIPFDFPEDICLNLRLPRGRLAMGWRRFKQSKLHENLDENKIDQYTHMPYFSPKNAMEKYYLKLREKKNQDAFLNVLDKYKLNDFGIIHFDGGIDFFSDSRMARKWKFKGKKIVNCYFGDDLRTRGIVKEMDEMSDLNLTFEYDHTLRHPNINFLFFPFDNSGIKFVNDEKYNSGNDLKVVHAPTDRVIKGTQEIIAAIEKAKKSKKFDFVLLENLPREKVIEEKAKCHIAIDQIGNRGGTGYGINSLETLSMGIPTITDMNCGFDTWLPENPFVVANADNLAEKLIELIDNEEYRRKKRKESRTWVSKYHSYESVFKKMHDLYIKHKIIPGDSKVKAEGNWTART